VTLTASPIPVSTSTTTSANAFGDTLTVTTNALNDLAHVIPVLETASGVILVWSPSSLNLALAQEGTPSSYTVENTGNVAAAINVALNNPGPASLTLNAPASGTAAAGAPFQGSVTEGLGSATSTNANVTVTLVPGAALCQPLPSPMTLVAN
jgi:hypothetical protein